MTDTSGDPSIQVPLSTLVHLTSKRDEARARVEHLEDQHDERGEFTAESDLAEFIVAARNAIPSLIAERDAALARIAAVEALTEQWDELLLTCSAIMTTAQRNAWKDALAELRAVLAASPTPTTEQDAPEDALGLNDDAKQIIAELRDLWQRALEREGNLVSAVADLVWKATQYGTTEDGDTFAYIVPKGTMHRLVGVAQSNGAHVPVSFRSASPTPTGPDEDVAAYFFDDGGYGSDADGPATPEPTEETP